jgi:hypothetical protein
MLEISDLIEVTLPDPDNFLKVRETLSRIGVASKKDSKDKTLYQSCHILHKRGRYAIVHFKQMFLMDGKQSDFSEEDRARLHTIANLLHEWGLVQLVEPTKSASPVAPLSTIKIISHKEKGDWNLVAKYNIGRKKSPTE